MPVEAIHPVIDRIDAGRLREGPAYATWRAHGTTDWLFVSTVGGHGHFGTPDGDQLAVTVGDQVLLRPGTLHDYGTAPGGTHWEIAYAHFHPRPDWVALLDWPERSPGLLHLHAEGLVHARIGEAMDRAAAVSRSGLRHAQLFGLNALETALLWCATQSPGARRLDPRLIAVVEHVGAHLAEPLTVRGLARVAGLSTSRLAHLFVAQLGDSPMHYVEQQRMIAARQLLDLTARSVTEVAAAVGFDDPLYFSSRFSKDSGQSPTAYRRRGS